MRPGKKDDVLFTDSEWRVLSRQLCLTDRQAQTVKLALAGRCDKEIAAGLGVSVPTVRGHFKCLFNKLQVQSRHELVMKVVRHYLKNLRPA